MSTEAMKLALEAIQDLRGYRPDIDKAIDAIRTAIKQADAEQPATGEPDEWKLVPIVPTEKMLLAYTGGAVTNAGFGWCRHQWSVMLAAAPAAPAAPAAHPAPSVPAAWTKDLFLVVHAMEMNNWHWKSSASDDLKRAAHAAAMRLYTASKIAAPSVPDDVVRDAERYRWLADCNNYEAGLALIIDPKLTAHTLGEKIDAAMLAAK